jgi:predicted component of type VI protein secretion system
MKYVHVRCLQHWLQNRAQTRTYGCLTTVLWKTFDCELCKRELPNRCKGEGRAYELIEIKRPVNEPYMILEIMSKDPKHPRGVHVLNFTTKSEIKMGRGHDCDLRIPDISVSRLHSYLRMENGEFFLEDNNSKFGSLVLIQNRMALKDEGKKLTIQVGRSVFNIQLLRSEYKCGFPTGCLGSTNSLDRDEVIETISRKGEMQTQIRNSGSQKSPSLRNPRPNLSMPQSPNNLIQGDEDEMDVVPEENNQLNAYIVHNSAQ